ncbi:MAG: His/Gly/Thr/Pro-type tRNA ligase C-terminal domain-containing protein, partial [Clostridia bacterium]|nr:His/Gly/Thr/Pro-type tRNA ligase C-terminal domain-containing protein [Clostridia bacterium]
EQARVLTITERADEWALAVAAQLRARGIRVETDLRNEKIGYKIREARNARVPYTVVIGDREAEAQQAAVTRRGVDLGVIKAEELISTITNDIESRRLD